MGNSRDTVDTGSPKRKQLKHDTTPTRTSHDDHPDKITTQIKEITKKTVQAIENTIKKASLNKILQNIKDFHRTTMLAITIATNTTDCTNHSKQAQINNRNTQNSPGTRKFNNKYNESYQLLTSSTDNYRDN